MIRILAAAALLCAPAFGYIRLIYTDTAGSVPYHRSDAAGIQFLLNDQIKPGQVSHAGGSNVTVVSANSDPTGAVRLALDQWNAASGGAVRFLPLQSTSAVHDSGDSKAVITFASADDLSVMGFVPGKSIGAIGLTVSVLATQTGRLANGVAVTRGDIVDSDILLNSTLPFSTDGSTPYDLQAVVTHELGHALGENHNGLLGSTMFPFSGPAQRLLTSDDRSFLAAAYPQGDPGFGTLSGRVTTRGGAAVKAALLTLVDSSAGQTISGITDSEGSYSLRVPAGVYTIGVEPMTASSPVEAWNIIGLDPSQVSSNFEPTMLSGAVSVKAGGTENAPDLIVSEGTGSLSFPMAALAGAGGSGGVQTVNGVNAPLVVASGQTVDLALIGGGLDGTETISVAGAGIAIRAGSLRVDPSERFASLPGSPLLRVTLDIQPRQTPELASIFLSKGSGAVALSGYLVIVPPTPSFTIAGVDSAAGSQWQGGVSPGGITAIYAAPGTQALGPGAGVPNTGFDAYGKLPGSLAGVSVTFDGVPAPLFYVSGNQINLQVPFEVAGKTSTQVVVGYQGSFSAPVTVPVAVAQPAFFLLNSTDAYAADADFPTTLKPNGAANPAARGKVISVYGTGAGNIYPAVTGAAAAGPPADYRTNYQCVLGSRIVSGLFAGWTPSSVGLAQWSFTIPADSDTGAVRLKCTDAISGGSTQTATIYIK